MATLSLHELHKILTDTKKGYTVDDWDSLSELETMIVAMNTKRTTTVAPCPDDYYCQEEHREGTYCEGHVVVDPATVKESLGDYNTYHITPMKVQTCAAEAILACGCNADTAPTCPTRTAQPTCDCLGRSVCGCLGYTPTCTCDLRDYCACDVRGIPCLCEDRDEGLGPCDCETDSCVCNGQTCICEVRTPENVCECDVRTSDIICVGRCGCHTVEYYGPTT